MTTMDVEAVIFDLDGTLIDYEGPSHEALAHPLKRFDKPFDWELHGKIVGTTPPYWSNLILNEHGLTRDVYAPEEYVKDYHIHVKSLYPDIPKMPGAARLITEFQALGIPMAIATSSIRTSFDAKMVFHEEFLHPMSAIVTGDEVENSKPAPDIFLLAAERLGADPSKCIVFEDSPHGVAGAKTAGAYAVALPDNRMPQNQHLFAIADEVLTHYDEFAIEGRIRKVPLSRRQG